MKKILFAIFCAICLISCANGNTSGKKENSEQRQLCGGYSVWREVTAEDLALFDKAREAFLAEKEVCTEHGCGVPEEFKPLETARPNSVRTQVVAGMNWHFKADSIEVIVFQPLPGQGDVQITSYLRK